MINHQDDIKEKLLEVGVKIDTIYDLVNTKENYPEAIPSLLNLIEQDYSPEIKEGVVRSLAVKEAKGRANNILFKVYHETLDPDSSLSWAIGNTIEVIVQDQDQDQIINILENKLNGRSRQMFAIALGKIKNEKSEDTLIECLKEDGLLIQTISALRKLKSTKALPEVRNLISHKNSVIARDAKKYIEKFEV